ncbi:hypothetical protein ACQ4M4_04880 [Leptolyngbya sp. AN02str]|uniref:hypothetical protein n=1 Tax=Leptolyngbya sp. AN02str TaxID=3423363 RepID=UPI003D314FEB
MILILATAIALSTYLETYQIPDPIFTDFYAQDVWFGSDIPTVFGNVTSFKSDFGRNNKHPLFPLFVFPLVYIPSQLLNLEPITAVRLLIVVTSMVWIGLLYLLFRLMGCRRLDAALLSVLGAASAASMFWLTVFESFPLGSVTIILGLIFAVLAQYRKFPFIWYVALNVVTVSITITNAMVGIFTTMVNQSWKRIIQIGIVSLLVSTGLWMAQRIVFTNSGFPFQPGTFIGEKKFMSAPEHSSVLASMSSFFYQTMIMPAVEFASSSPRPDWIKLDVDTLALASGSRLGAIAALAWTGLLLLGLWGFFSTKKHPKLRIVLGLTLAAQMAMHSIYGAEETFIYSLHFAPLLLTLASFSLFTRCRLVSLGLIVILIVSAGVTNRAQFNHVTAMLLNYGTSRQQVEAQMKLRPSDPWMRNEGHVVLAATGSLEENKAFHEPGGSFSPQPGSFGISIWVVNSQGNLQATSDNIPLSEIQQQFIDNVEVQIPGIDTKTPYYHSSWLATQSGGWQLNLEQTSTADTKLAVVIRSVGPAGGAISALQWNGQQLLINNRWVVKNIPAQTTVYLGSERSPNWTRSTSTATEWQDEYGWGFARLEVNGTGPWQLDIEDLNPEPGIELAIANSGTEPVLQLPDSKFVNSFKAQLAHLKMGIVGSQTRPGDPLDYPLPRFRDGAYQLVALARAGQLELAKQLLPYFATTDFLNGIQPAVDIPAYGIWALTTVAEAVNQAEYDQTLWPDIRRKAELIVELITSNRPGYPMVSSSQMPFSEHPDFARVELTAGRMNATPGLIALDPAANFMSYRALMDAAKVAERMQQSQLTTRWRSQASQLQTAWQENFDLQFAEIDATYATGLWPSGLAFSQQQLFKQGLEDRWQAKYQGTDVPSVVPDNPLLTLAEAHQWLYLGDLSRVWATMQQFWNHQTSPGLYTWWNPQEANIPSSLSRWQRIRGWVNTSQLTPHHWTTAEMLLLQLDMLAYLNPSVSTPTVVIGAGIPQDWTQQPLSAKGLRVGGNVVDWEWDGQQMNVQLQGQPMNVQLGDSFPSNTAVNVALASPS